MRMFHNNKSCSLSVCDTALCAVCHRSKSVLFDTMFCVLRHSPAYRSSTMFFDESPRWYTSSGCNPTQTSMAVTVTSAITRYSACSSNNETQAYSVLRSLGTAPAAATTTDGLCCKCTSCTSNESE